MIDFDNVIELTADGFPTEAAAQDGYGLPVYWLGETAEFFVDGEKVERVVAYSIPKGWLVALAVNAKGRAYRDLATEKVAVIRREGLIEVKRKAAK